MLSKCLQGVFKSVKHVISCFVECSYSELIADIFTFAREQIIETNNAMLNLFSL